MTGKINFDNGYSIQMEKEKISHVGRSIYRGFDDKQVVLKIVDPDGRVTNRLPIPARYAAQVADFMAQ